MHSVKPTKRVAKQQKIKKLSTKANKHTTARTTAKRTVKTATKKTTSTQPTFSPSSMTISTRSVATSATPSIAPLMVTKSVLSQQKFSFTPTPFQFQSLKIHTASTKAIPSILHGLKLPSNFGTVSKTPFKTTKRGFLGGIGGAAGNALGSLFGGAKKEDKPGQMNMMQMMEMMTLMQKLTKSMQGGTMGDKEYDELLKFVEKLKDSNGGKLPPEMEPLFEKIKTRQPITQNELMAITGMNSEDLNEMREATLKMKSGQMNQMQFFMTITTVMQRVEQRKSATPKIEKE